MGLFTILVVVSVLVRGSAIIGATVADGPVMLVYAIFSIAIGIAMILGHNVWSGGAASRRHNSWMADSREGSAATVP
jgi:hypothetical protein